MILERNTAERVAELLLQIKAIKLNTKNYFTWASGWASPIYCDNRILLSYPKLRKEVALLMAHQIKDKFSSIDIIASVATGAIGIGTLVADILDAPMIYVRPEPKKHGRGNQIEGRFSSGQKIVVIEDLISTGKSSLNAVNALLDQDLEVLGLCAIFSYDFDIARINFEKEKYPLYTLSDYHSLLKKSLEIGYIKTSDMDELNKWRINPETYGITDVR